MKSISPALMLIALLSLAGCNEHQPAAQPAPPRTVQATSQVLVAVDLPDEQAMPGTVLADERAEVASRLMGHLREIAVEVGQRVRRGQALFTVDPVDVTGQVEVARLAVSQAENAYSDARADLTRFDALLKDEVVSRQQYDKVKLQHDTAADRLAQARASLASAKGQLAYARVNAPIDGVVTRKLAHVGDMAAPGQPVLVLENLARLQVETPVPASLLASLKPGQTVPVEIEGQRLAGTIARLSPAADPVSHTFPVRIDVAGEGVRSGAFARVLFPGPSRTALLLPASAVVNRAGIEGVFVLDAQGTAAFRMVRVSPADPGRVEVLSGLAAGERVVTDGAATLETGDRVAGASKAG